MNDWVDVDDTILREEIIRLGRESVLAVTGFPGDELEITKPSQAIAAIRAELELGRKAHHEWQTLLHSCPT